VRVEALVAPRPADEPVPQKPHGEAEQKDRDEALLLNPSSHDAGFGWHCAKNVRRGRRWEAGNAAGKFPAFVAGTLRLIVTAAMAEPLILALVWASRPRGRHFSTSLRGAPQSPSRITNTRC
jgi:hypothetical protein